MPPSSASVALAACLGLLGRRPGGAPLAVRGVKHQKVDNVDRSADNAEIAQLRVQKITEKEVTGRRKGSQEQRDAEQAQNVRCAISTTAGNREER